MANKFIDKISILLITLLMLSTVGCGKDKVIPIDKVPNEIKTYTSKHFPENNIIQVTKNVDGFKTTYDVILKDNIKLEFNKKKEVISIDSNKKLPNSVIPKKIKIYVSKNFPENVITGWEIDDKKQEVELDNDLELEFTMENEFIHIND